ncbi:hypothetical protein NS183_07930 [Microbacterium testaceum]|nr:hypothetical protein NS183_07930 [Microbacterium testaceum]
MFPEDREEFTTILRGLVTIPGADVPVSKIGVAATVHAGDVTFRVYAPASMRSTMTVVPVSPEIDAAIADVMAVAS